MLICLINFLVCLCLAEEESVKTSFLVDHFAFQLGNPQHLSAAKYEVAKQFFLDALRDRVPHSIRADNLPQEPKRSLDLTLAIDPQVGEQFITRKHEHYDGERLKDSYRILIARVNEQTRKSSLDSSDVQILVSGGSLRGLLYGMGRLLTDYFTFVPHLQLALPQLSSLPVDVTMVPEYAVRGHRINYLEISNTYDAWNLTQLQQYIRDLILSTTNVVEFPNPDGQTSPHFTMTTLQFNSNISLLCDVFGLNASLYYYIELNNPNWGEDWKNLKRLDRLFIPSGDSGGGKDLSPAAFLSFLNNRIPKLFQSYPGCEVWISDQTWTKDSIQQLYRLLQTPPAWLTGVMYGPHTVYNISATRKSLPSRLALCHYPDLAHQIKAQFPEQGWYPRFALTLARESVNPRPEQYRNIFLNTQPYTIGFNSYDEGVTADANMMLWSYLGWNSKYSTSEFWAAYAKWFAIGGNSSYLALFAELGSRLERHWIKPEDDYIRRTLVIANEIRRLTPSHIYNRNWRFQSLMLRAYYDSFQQFRFREEEQLEFEAIALLKEAKRLGSLDAMTRSAQILATPLPAHLLAQRKECFTIALLLYQTIGIQTSVKSPFLAAGTGRGAVLDTIDNPLNNVRYLLAQFAIISKLKSEQARLQAIEAIVNWRHHHHGEHTHFYDDLGNVLDQPHLLPGLGPAQDPSYYDSALSSFQEGLLSTLPPYPKSWYVLLPIGLVLMFRYDWAETFYDTPLMLFYPRINGLLSYDLRVVYPIGVPQVPMRLVAQYGSRSNPFLVHDWLLRPNPIVVLNFTLPSSASAEDSLLLTWTANLTVLNGGNGRGCQVAEVWLLGLV